jgi:hypothetical protein
MAHPTFYLPLYLYAYVQYYLSNTKDTSGTLEYAATATLPNLQFHFFPSQKRSTHHLSPKHQWPKPHRPKGGHYSQTSASTDLMSLTISPWSHIQPERTICSPAPSSIIHAPPHHHSQPNLPPSMNFDANDCSNAAACTLIRLRLHAVHPLHSNTRIPSTNLPNSHQINRLVWQCTCLQAMPVC